jgi:hypothetical protein
LPDYDKVLTTSSTKGKPGYYLYEIPGKSLAIYISLDVVDRLSQEVMRGFGAVPKRGAEVGGMLMGKAATVGDLLNVEIEDFEAVQIEYRRGPSYLLSDADQKAFAETFGRLRNGVQNGFEPIGMFRSQTRDATGLGPEDLQLADAYFPGPNNVFLLIRPYATKVSTAGFYFREKGIFQSGPPLEQFPFRRKELCPGEEPRPRSRDSAAASEHPRENAVHGDANVVPVSRHELLPLRLQRPEAAPAAGETPDLDLKPRGRSGWVWLPLSFIFLLLGVLLGFQAALTLRPQMASADPFNVSLSVSKEGDNLSIRWDRQAAAIKAARQGVLVIEDGTYNKTVELDPSQLQTGSVVYRHNSNDVKFRLELNFRDRDLMTEMVEWKQ